MLHITQEETELQTALELEHRRIIRLLTEYNAAPPRALLTKEHIAAALGISVAKVDKDLREGAGLPYVRLNDSPTGAVRFRKMDADRYLTVLKTYRHRDHELAVQAGKAEPLSFEEMHGEGK